MFEEEGDDELDRLLLGMAEGATHRAKMRARVDHEETQTRGNPQNRLSYHLHFQFPFQNDPDAEFSDVIMDPERSSFLTITRDSRTEWTIEAPGDFGKLGILFTRSGSEGHPVLEDQGSYNMPFEMRVICEACPAAPDS